ncbi:MAG TPA: queuosine salvage family protein [Kiritimatiellia bacterium]|nr:queuosine salvage family protein [Kiritimatiellia bacterium]
MSGVRVNHDQVERFAEFLPGLGTVSAFDFCSGGEGVLFPAAGARGALEAFFFNAAHQFGFWYLKEGRYERPMIARGGGVMRKGSDFLFFCTQRALSRDPDLFQPARLGGMSDAECSAMFEDDEGNNPLPMWKEHLRILREYAEWFVRGGTTPRKLVDVAAGSEKPLATLLELLREVPGYREDRLQKKAMLLAIILENRPERFLRVTDGESAVPIIDYHLQRSALRTGLVEVTEDWLRGRLERREEVAGGDEAAVREATYEAVERLVKESGLSVAAVDYFFFTNRTRCPEMSEPDCPACPVASICARRVDLFQPVYRTEAY